MNTPDERFDEQRAHRYFAADAFNRCWELIRLEARTPEQDREMLRRAEVSYWHWMQFEGRTPKNEAIGCWQLARVYALAGSPAVALVHARRNLEISVTGQLGPFYEGYAHEALARAHQAAGQEAACREALEAARACASRVTDPESLQLLESDLSQLGAALDR